MPNGTPTPAELRANLDSRTAQMLEHVKQFVNIESPSNEPELLQRSAEFLAKVMTDDQHLRVVAALPVHVRAFVARNYLWGFAKYFGHHFCQKLGTALQKFRLVRWRLNVDELLDMFEHLSSPRIEVGAQLFRCWRPVRQTHLSIVPRNDTKISPKKLRFHTQLLA